MSIGRESGPEYSRKTLIPKRIVNTKKILKKIGDQLKENSSRTFVMIGLLFTGVGEFLGGMSIGWYLILATLIGIYGFKEIRGNI